MSRDLSVISTSRSCTRRLTGLVNKVLGHSGAVKPAVPCFIGRCDDAATPHSYYIDPLYMFWQGQVFVKRHSLGRIVQKLLVLG